MYGVGGVEVALQALGKQFKQAASRNAARVVILEADFSQARTVQVKDMASGRQVRLALEAFLADPMGALPADT